MTPEDRSVPLPDDREAPEDVILWESEERVAGAVEGDAPADDADEHRRSEDTV